MCNPPLSDGVSEKTKALYLKETHELLESLKERAKYVSEGLRGMKNITVNEVEGAMYAFPSVHFSKKAIEAAGDLSPDVFYCLEVLRNTGIVLVPGSGFHQRPGTYHFRITILILPEEKMKIKMGELKSFNDVFHERYE